MPEAKTGTFNQIMDLIEDDIEQAEIQPEPADAETGQEEAEQELAEPADETTNSTTEVIESTETEEEEDEEDGTEEEGEDTETDTEDDDATPDGEVEEADGEVEEEEDEPLSWTVKIDGKELEVDEEELVRGYQTAKASTKRFSEAKKMIGEAQAFYKALTGENNPGNALVAYETKQNGGDRVKARAAVVQKMLEFMAPEIEELNIEDERERELHKQRREIAEQQKALEEQQNEARTRQERAAEEEFISDLRVGIEGQIKKLKLPNKDEIWQKAGELLDAAKTAGSTNDEILELVPTVMKRLKEERKEAAKTLASTLTPEELEELYPEQMKQLKAKRVKRLKEKKKVTKKKAPEQQKEPSKPKRKKRNKPKAYSSLDVFNELADEIAQLD